MRAQRAFLVEMVVLIAFIVGFFIADATIHDSWKASHIGAYAYLAAYVIVITQLTFFLVLKTGDA
jgi:hypothetical protein